MSTAKPIIIVGSGRCGSTIFHRMLSEHAELAWLSTLCDKYPQKPISNKILLTAIGCQPLEKILRKKFPPGECYRFWENYSKAFRRPCRDLLATDVSVKVKNDIVNAMSRMITKKRNRLLLKVTGWPRIGFLSELFGDAKFIHVIRDGRAVVNSLVNVGFWRGWEGPEQWRWGPLSAAHYEEWNEHNQSFIVLAAIQWKMLMDAAEKAKQNLEKARFLEVKYEELCSSPVSLFMEVAEFCEIKWDDRFEARLKKHSLKSTNEKYRKELNGQQLQELNSVLNGHLQRYGYLTA